MKFLRSIFSRPAPEAAMQTMLYEARRAAIEHEAAAEHHDALAMMYRSRIERLEAAIGANTLMPVGMAK